MAHLCFGGKALGRKPALRAQINRKFTAVNGFRALERRISSRWWHGDQPGTRFRGEQSRIRVAVAIQPVFVPGLGHGLTAMPAQAGVCAVMIRVKGSAGA